MCLHTANGHIIPKEENIMYKPILDFMVALGTGWDFRLFLLRKDENSGNQNTS